MTTTVDPAIVADLEGQISGSVLGPHDAGHEAAAYGPNYQRLRQAKRRYDPDNVFHLNHNVAP